MKCRLANKYLSSFALIALMSCSSLARAEIESTVMANYDLSTGKNTHYQMVVSNPGDEPVVTVRPLGGNNNSPSVIKVSACTDRHAGTARQGIFKFSQADTDKTDELLSSIGSYVNENNMRTWWIHLNEKQNLVFNQDLGGLVILDPNAFGLIVRNCKTH